MSQESGSNHFGSRAKLRQALVTYCHSHQGFEDIPALCGVITSDSDKESGKGVAGDWKPLSAVQAAAIHCAPCESCVGTTTIALVMTSARSCMA
jgi:hypothetical protein